MQVIGGMERRGQMKGGRRICGKRRVILVENTTQETGVERRKKVGKKSKEAKRKTKKNNCRLITTKLRQHAQNYGKRKLKR